MKEVERGDFLMVESWANIGSGQEMSGLTSLTADRYLEADQVVSASSIYCQLVSMFVRPIFPRLIVPEEWQGVWPIDCRNQMDWIQIAYIEFSVFCLAKVHRTPLPS